MAKYRKKPVVIEAVQWTGHNISEICKFTDRDVNHLLSCGELYIKTLEGVHHASVGDYIIKGVKGEFYPCKPDIFAQTYEPADSEDPEPLRPKGRWVLDVKSFYMDNYDESCELCVYIVATCSECGKKHPSSGQVFSRHLYAPEDANEDFRFDEDEEKAKALAEYKASLKNGVSTLANFCPNCGAKMEG